MKARQKWALVFALVVIIAAASATWALAQSDGLIYACADNKTGVIHLAKGPQQCTAKEKALAWNITGQAGPAGPQGEKGDPGPAGADGPVGPKGDSGLSRPLVPADNQKMEIAKGEGELDGALGQYHAVTIGADGMPIIAFVDDTSGILRAAHCQDAACADKSISTLDGSGYALGKLSIVIGADGLPIISYFHEIPMNPGRELWTAHCGDSACTSAELMRIDSVSIQTQQSSAIFVGADGLPAIAFVFDNVDPGSNGALKFALCSNAACSEVNVSTLREDRLVHGDVSAALGTDGKPLIVFYDSLIYSNVPIPGLVALHCSDSNCLEREINPLMMSPYIQSRSNGLVIGSDGYPLISYYSESKPLVDYEYEILIMHCLNNPCSDKQVSIIEKRTNAEIGNNNAITIGADALPFVVYHEGSLLKAAHCKDAACTTATINVIDGNIDGDTSISLGADGMPVILYHRTVNMYGPVSFLRMIRCANTFCLPYFTRR